MARRGRPPKAGDGGIPPRPEVSPPLPVAEAITVCSTVLEAACIRLRIGLGDIKRYEDGGDEVEIVTTQGIRLRVKRADLPLEARP